MVKIADTIESVSDFPSMMAKSLNIVKEDGSEKSLQSMYEDGELGGSGVIDDEKTSTDSTWSSKKINDSLVDIEKNYGKKEIADCNTVEETISYIAPSTLHSPKAEGLTNNARGILISAIREAPDDYCVQTAILNGSSQHFTRCKLPNNDWRPWVELATMDKVKDGYTKIIKNKDTDINDAMVIAYKNSDLFGIRIYKNDDSEYELRFSASGISYIKNGATIWTK